MVWMNHYDPYFNVDLISYLYSNLEAGIADLPIITIIPLSSNHWLVLQLYSGNEFVQNVEIGQF